MKNETKTVLRRILREVGYSESMVKFVMSGRRGISLAKAVLIEEEYGVSPGVWEKLRKDKNAK